MGWLFMRSLGGHATPKAYLDAQFTYEQPDGRSRVLASRLVGMRTYYGAVEHVAAGSSAREVWGLVCLVRYNRATGKATSSATRACRNRWARSRTPARPTSWTS